MRKISVFLPIFALLTGAIACILRKWQLETIFDSATGLAQKNAPITLELIVLCAAVSMCAVIFSLAIGSGYTATTEFEKSFRTSNIASLAVSLFLGCVICFFSATWIYIEVPSISNMTVFQFSFFILAFLSGISVILLSVDAYKGRRAPLARFFSVIPSLFFCLWLLLTYKYNSRNPVLLDYCFTCLALAASCLSFFFEAGFLFENIKIRLTILFNVLGIFFCTLSLADFISSPECIIILAFALVQSVNLSRFLKNLTVKL